jgi:hypothetical protein
MRYYRLGVILAVPCLLATVLTACSATGGTVANCDTTGFRIRVHNGKVHGFAGVDCHIRPQSVEFTTRLQYKSASLPWQNVGRPSFSSEIPSPSADYHVIASCAPGQYRVKIWVKGTDSAGKPGSGSAKSDIAAISNCNADFDTGVEPGTGF